jgi:hydrogenase nickel incorporation protein HypA/HybF
MHEMALAQNILDIVLDAARRHGAHRVRRISIRAGRLRGIIPEQLQFCFGFVAKDSIAEGADLSVVTVPIKARCKACGREFLVEEFKFICPDCNDPHVETLQGLELLVENIEVV